MKRSPQISVLIPAYNMDAYIGRAITSVLNGSFKNLEIIVIDDGSKDNTKEIVNNFTNPETEMYDYRVKYVRQANQGKPAAVNHGFKKSRGEYITILDADDELPANSLESRYSVVEQSAHRIDCIVGSFSIINEYGQIVGHRSVPQTSSTRTLWRKYFLSYRTPFHLNACLIHQDVVNDIGLIDTTLTRCEDIDYALRLLRTVDTFEVIKSDVYHYRKYRASRHQRIRMRWTTLKKRYVVLKRHAPSPVGTPAALMGVLLDAIKLAYETFAGNYTS